VKHRDVGGDKAGAEHLPFECSIDTDSSFPLTHDPYRYLHLRRCRLRRLCQSHSSSFSCQTIWAIASRRSHTQSVAANQTIDPQLLPNGTHSASHPRQKYLTDTHMLARRVSRQLPDPTAVATTLSTLFTSTALPWIWCRIISMLAHAAYTQHGQNLFDFDRQLVAWHSQKINQKSCTRKWSLLSFFSSFLPVRKCFCQLPTRPHILVVVPSLFFSWILILEVVLEMGFFLISVGKQRLLDCCSNWITAAKWTFNEACPWVELGPWYPNSRGLFKPQHNCL